MSCVSFLGEPVKRLNAAAAPPCGYGRHGLRVSQQSWTSGGSPEAAGEPPDASRNKLSPQPPRYSEAWTLNRSEAWLRGSTPCWLQLDSVTRSFYGKQSQSSSASPCSYSRAAMLRSDRTCRDRRRRRAPAAAPPSQADWRERREGMKRRRRRSDCEQRRSQQLVTVLWFRVSLERSGA